MIIDKNCFAVIDNILNQNFFDEVLFNYHFDFEENNFASRKEYRRHLSMFSLRLLYGLVILIFLPMLKIMVCAIISAFSGVLIRMYLNVTLNYVSVLFSSITLSDEKR